MNNLITFVNNVLKYVKNNDTADRPPHKAPAPLAQPSTNKWSQNSIGQQQQRGKQRHWQPGSEVQ